MTHEIKQLFETLKTWQQLGKKAVFVSVVALEGSSYRRPGVRTIISEEGDLVGAVSGGCVENEIERQAQSVFQSGIAKMITYDGRLRIGCEGIIHILIEPVFLTGEILKHFETVLKSRQKFRMDAYFHCEVGEYKNIGTQITLNGKTWSLNPSFTLKKTKDQECFSQTFEPLFQLYIFGAEHDAVQLSQAAKLLGWEVTIVASAKESKSCDYFPGASALITPSFNDIDTSVLDEQTAVVLMTHSFNKDVQYLLAMKDIKPAYLGIIGTIKRRERILSTLLDYYPAISPEFLEQIHGPAGINIGAETASEIAVSVLAEILSVVRRQNPVALREKMGSIHG
jgi:xanthine/CO dehydrogenase XdhC/CoxF family maturation factor